MPKPHPEEFRNDVVAFARKREVPWTQIAKDFGSSEASVHNWVKKADIADGLAAAPAAKKSAELREGPQTDPAAGAGGGGDAPGRGLFVPDVNPK